MTSRQIRLLHVLAFIIPLFIFTTMLLVPRPLPEKVTKSLDLDLQYILNKAAHMGGYAYLAITGFLLPRVTIWRWVMVGGVLLHGIATEIGQTFVPNRSGSVRDVLIDWTGVFMGVGVGVFILRCWPRFFRG
jgi:VanZ family protein